MSTYTQDITHLINKIDTNIPDNDTQYITAARIRDAMGAVAYNYDLYVLKTDLDTAGYVTASALSGYATQEDLQTGMQSVLDDSYAYVVDKINEIPGIDLSAYVTKSQLSQELGSYVTKLELSEMGYITEAALDGLATEAYVEDYVAHHTPTPDLSAYVTKTELSAAGYLTSIPSEYVTESEIATMGYITDTELSSMGYITENDLPDMSTYATKTYVADYVASHSGPIDLSAYVTKDELSAAGYLTAVPSEYITDTELSNVLSAASYVTQNELSNVGYITNSDLSQASYVTQQALSAMGYITSSALPTMSDYVSKTELSQAGYLTSIPSEYITESELDLMGYITSSALSGLATETYVADYVATYAPTPDLSAYVTKSQLNQELGSYVTKTELSNAGYITSIPNNYATYDAISEMGYITSSALSGLATETYVADYVAEHAPMPDLSSYVTKTELSNAGYLTSIPSEYVTESELSSMGYITSSALPTMSDYVSKTELSQAGYLTSIPSEYITESELSSMGYITSIPNNYATYDAISQMGYITSSDIPTIPVIDESIIPNTTNTYTLGDSSHIYKSTYTSKLYLGSNITIAPENNAQIGSDVTININGSQKFYLNSNRFAPNGSSNNKAIDLGTSDRMWRYTCSYQFYENGTNIKDIYATKVELPKIDESIIPNTTNTYTLGDSSHIYNATYSRAFYTRTNNLTGFENNNNYTSIYVRVGGNLKLDINSSDIRPTTNKNYSLGTTNQQFSYTYSQYFIENGTNIKDIYTQAYVLTQSQYDGLSQSDKDKETIYIISDQQAYMNNELVTETSLDSRGFLTAANFNYDPTTGTLTLNL